MQGLKWASIALVLIAIFALGLVMLASGVPYHDGPNAGYVNPPGFLRLIERASAWLCLGVAAALLTGIAGLLTFLLRRAKRS